MVGGQTRRHYAAVFVVTLLVALLASRRLGAQDLTCDPGDVEVRRLEFVGNSAFSDGELELLINTTATSGFRTGLKWIGIGYLFWPQRCLDRPDFPLDRVRLLVFYRNKGFDRAAVDTAVTTLAPGQVGVRFIINESEPVRIDSLVYKGMDSVPDAAHLLRGLPLRKGGLFDRYAMDTTQLVLARRLRSAGYPRADVLRSFSTNAEARSATVEMTVVPGPLARYGDVHVEVTPREGTDSAKIAAGTVRRLLGVKSGDRYSESDLVVGQRRLYQTEAYRSVRVDLDSLRRTPTGGALQDITVRVSEAEMRSATAGLGWGSIDCFRGQGSFTSYNFLGGARRLDLTGRVSKIGIGDPTRFLGSSGRKICPGADADQYSDKANYYLGATLRQPVLFGIHSLPSLTVFRERRSEYNAYRRTTPLGALASFNSNRVPGLPLTFTYNIERGATSAQPAFFCAIQLVCDRADIERAESFRRLGVVSLAGVRDKTNDPLSPSQGYASRFEIRSASPWVGSEKSLQFNSATAEFSRYFPVRTGVLAFRLRGGLVMGTRLATLFKDEAPSVPPQERLYGGGPNSVRGYRQNELGPSAYLVTVNLGDPEVDASGDTVYRTTDLFPRSRVVPGGGNTLVIGNVEYRTGGLFYQNLVQLAAFVDGGQVWNRARNSFRFGGGGVRYTPGAGLRILSPFGAVRFDLGYNGSRPSPGPLYFDEPFTTVTETVAGATRTVVRGGGLYCRVAGANEFRNVDKVGVSGCASDYQPNTGQRWYQRFVPVLSIGQAF